MLERQQQLPGAINTDTGRPNENENKIEEVEDREWEYPWICKQNNALFSKK